MGVQDAFEIFCTDLDVTGNANATTDSTNSINLGARLDNFGAASTPDIGWGEPVYIKVEVTTTFTDTGTSALICDLYHDTATGLGSGVLYQRLGTIPALSADGYQLNAIVAPGTMNRYAYLVFTVSGATSLDTGTVSAALCPNPESDAAS